MIFDKNQKEFPSDIHKNIWNIGIHILNVEITLPNEVRSKMPSYLVESCMQMQEYFLHLFGDMYENVDIYEPLPRQTFRLFIDFGLLGEATEEGLVISRIAFDNFIKKTEKSKDYKGDKKLNINLNHRLGLLERTGLMIQYKNDIVTLSNELYPHMFHAIVEMAKITLKEKASEGNSFTYCDFRKLCKSYKYNQYESALVFLSNEQREIAKKLDSIAKQYKLTPHMSKGHCSGYTIEYHYKKIRLMEVCCLGNQVSVNIRILFDKSNPTDIDCLFGALEKESDELKKLFLRKLKRCRYCNPACGGYSIRIFNKPNKICFTWVNALRIDAINMGGRISNEEVPLYGKILEWVIELNYKKNPQLQTI